MVPKSADCATAGPRRCPPGPSTHPLPPGPLLGVQVGMAQLLCSRGAGSPSQGYGPSGVAGAAVSFVGASASAGWGRWVEEVSTGAQVGVPGVSPSLATGPQCLLQCRASNTYSQDPDGPLSFQGLRQFGSNRFLLRTEGRQVP